MTFHRTGLLIIRAWLERGSSQPLRAHIRLTTDVGSGFASETTLTDATTVSETVEAWLDDVLLDGEQR